MSNGITAVIGADASQVEGEMTRATRAVNTYADAVQNAGKAGGSTSAGGGFVGQLSSNLPKVLSSVKSLSGALGQAALAAGLVPGLGVAAIGVAAVVAGVNYIRKGYEDAAKAADELRKSTRDIMAQSAAIFRAGEDSKMSDEDRLSAAESLLKSKQAEWRVAVALGEDDLDIATKRLAFDQASAEAKKLRAKAIIDAASEESKSNKESSEMQEQDMKLWFAAQKRKEDAEKDLADMAEKEAKDLADKNKKLDEEASDRNKKIIDEQAAAMKQADEMAYERKWKFATDEQKMAQAKKEGQEAFARAQFEANGENLRDLEKARKKYIDLQEAISGKKGGKGGGESLMNNGVKVSAEDRARTNAASAQAEKYNEESKRGRIESSAGIGEGKSKTEDIVKPMQDLLKEVQNLTKKFN